MFCNDFIFDGEKLSDYGWILCSIDNNDSSWSGSDVTFTIIKPPSSNKVSKTNSKFENQLTTTVQIMKNPCSYTTQNDMYLTSDDQSKMMRWLQRTDGYHWLSFDQEWYEDIWYNAQINPKVIFIKGHPVGFELVITTDSPYAYSQLHTTKFTLEPTDVFNLYDYSDLTGFIYPRATITVTNAPSDGYLCLRTLCIDRSTNKIYDDTQTRVESIKNGDVIILDGNFDFVSGISNMNLFNYSYPRISNSYKNQLNEIENRGNCTLSIVYDYRYIRRVVV